MDPEQPLSVADVLALSPEAQRAYVMSLPPAQRAAFDQALDKHIAAAQGKIARLEHEYDARHVRDAIDQVAREDQFHRGQAALDAHIARLRRELDDEDARRRAADTEKSTDEPSNEDATPERDPLP